MVAQRDEKQPTVIVCRVEKWGNFAIYGASESHHDGAAVRVQNAIDFALERRVKTADYNLVGKCYFVGPIACELPRLLGRGARGEECDQLAVKQSVVAG